MVISGFVALKVAEAGGVGVERIKGAGGARGIAGGLLLLVGGKFVVQEAGFEADGAAKTPFGPGHFLDAEEFGWIEGREAVDQRCEEGFEPVSGFIGEQSGLSRDAVRDAIESDAGPAGRGDGALRASAVGSRGLDLFESTHGLPLISL